MRGQADERTRRKKRKQSGRSLVLLLVLLGAAMSAVLLGWRYYLRQIQQDGIAGYASDQTYDRHYVMIADDSSSLLWQDIYQNAKRAAVECGAYLELLNDWESVEYELTDYMNIAVASKVDGIIVKPDGTVKMRQAINAAEAAGIPVITVLEDDSASDRTSFVGVNSYQLGTVYGTQILSCVDADTRQITVLLNRSDAGKDLVYKQLRATVQEGLARGQTIGINSLTNTPGSFFGAEELLRNLLQDEAQRPDILVCINETDSECAYYAMVDYNQVGSVKLIGYYQTERMLAAVQKGIVPIVITLDTAQLGTCSIEALEEYYSMGYVSSYFSVDLDIITQENVQQFLETETS